MVKDIDYVMSMLWGVFTLDGGPGSGNHNHAGRPGKVGGSTSTKPKVTHLSSVYKKGLTDRTKDGLIPLLDRTAKSNDVVKWLDEKTGKVVNLTLQPGSKITDIKVFAADELKRKIDIGYVLEAKTGISRSEWGKVGGHGTVRVNGELRGATLHWFEARGKVYSRKVKGWRK